MSCFHPHLYNGGKAGVRAVIASCLIAVLVVLCGDGKSARAQNVQWANRYDAATNAGSSGSYIALDKQGNVLVTGSTAISADTSNGFIGQIRTIKYDGQGRQLWTAAYRSQYTYFNGSYSTSINSPTALRVGASGDVYISGRTEAANGLDDVIILKYNGATGAQIWANRINGADDNNERNSKIVIDASENVYLGCNSYAIATGADWLLAKYDKNGAQQWRVTANPGGGVASDDVAGLSINSAGTALAVTGFSDAATNSRMMTAKYATATGARQWVVSYVPTDPLYNKAFSAVTAIDLDGNVYAAAILSPTNSSNSSDALVVKYNGANGAQLWTSQYNDFYDESPTGMLLDSAGNVILAGNSRAANGTVTTFLVRLDAANGATLWHNDNEPGQYNYTGNSQPSALGTDSAGNLYTTVTGVGPSGYYSVITRKYEKGTGLKTWEAAYTPPALNSYAAALVADATGNVYVTGYARTASYYDQFLTLKLSPYKYTATDVAVGGDGKPRLLFTTSDHATFQLWRVGTTGAAEVKKTYTPPAKFAPVAITCGPDNKTRVLMTRSTDAVSYTAVFAADLSVQSTSFVMSPPQSGTVAFDLAVGKTNQSLIAWKRSAGLADNRLYSQTVTGDATLAATYAYGPYANLVPIAISTSQGDGKNARSVAQRVTQQIAAWVLKADASAAESGKYYLIPSGYDIRDMTASGTDNTTNLLWADTTGRLALWQLNPAQSAITFSKVYGPYIGLTGRKIVVSPVDNKVRLLWNDTTGKTVLWTIGTTGTIEAGYTYPAF